jgi:hypothetical protein
MNGTNEKLLSSLSKLGLPLFEPAEELNANETLAEVVKSCDTRLWEAFPVLLANAADRYDFSPEAVEGRLSREQKKDFHQLMLLSGALYAYFHVSFSWWSKFNKGLASDEKNQVKAWRDSLAHEQPLTWDGTRFDAERLKETFSLYFEKKAERDRQRKERYEEFSLEYAMSQVFSPKQKELFKKRFEGLPLNKTEQEYYSRTVKKKVVALANSELHSMAKKLLEQ